jgi:hypothetical protein
LGDFLRHILKLFQEEEGERRERGGGREGESEGNRLSEWLKENDKSERKAKMTVGKGEGGGGVSVLFTV